ncbi:MAG: sigma-54-dependent Fis family transcriptional regulator, partial [Proteobacteria bacterium]
HFALLVSRGDEILPEHLNLPAAANTDLLVHLEQLLTQAAEHAEPVALAALLNRSVERLRKKA